MNKLILNGILLSTLLFSGVAFSSDYTIPNTFSAGNPALASDVNANFTAAQDAINDNQNQLDGKQERVSGTCAAGSSIRVINTNGTVTCEVDSDSGDITGVTAGSGLTGGGTSGSVSISIPTGGVTSTHILNNSVSSTDILNNSIYDVDQVDEAGLDYSGSGYYDIANLNTCSATTNIASVSVTAPTSGYIMVSASGRMCTYPAGEWTWIMLGDNPSTTTIDYDGNNYFYDYETTQRACGIGQYSHYSFQNVYPVSAGVHTYYLKGCSESTAGDGNLYYHPMVGIFFPTRY